MTLSPGTRIGPYQILSKLGEGGMGAVYRAADARLGRDVALKVLPPDTARDPDRLARFQREARAVAALNHPHIVTIHSVEAIDGVHFLTMELVDGLALDALIPGAGLPVDRVLSLGVALADALTAAHDKGIVHRDLKPANVMLTTDGRVKVVDFGLAKDASAGESVDATMTAAGRTGIGVVMGTPGYMSPEQVTGRAVDHRTDLFSLGVLLYQLASGVRPFAGDSAIEVASAILRDDPRPLTEMRPDLPADLVRLVRRCLDKDPQRRVQTARDVANALRDIAPGHTGKVARSVTSTGASPSSIAVLPFVNMSGDVEQEYFSDGLAEEVINMLAKVPGLKVSARTSAFAFKGQHTDVRKIAETLGVAHLLEGSVRRAGNRIRVTAQLVTAADGSPVWSERYDRELADVFAVQDEIAAAIADALGVALAPDHDAKRYKPVLEAYEAYLKGHHFQFKLTPESLALAKQAYEQAIALDPHFAMARVGQADYFLTVGAIGLMPAREAMPLVREHARRALEIDPSLAEAHAMLGIVAGVHDYDWEEADRRFGRAFGLAPGSNWVRSWRSGFFLMWVGRPVEGIALVQQSLREDPLNTIFRWNLALALLAAGRVDEGAAELRHILEIDENFWFACYNLAILHASAGEMVAAHEYGRRARAIVPRAPQVAGLTAGLLSITGDKAAADAIVNDLRPDDNMVPTGLAVFHFLRGDIAEAARWIERGIDQRDPQLVSVTCVSFGRTFFESPYWPPLAKRMNLPT